MTRREISDEGWSVLEPMLPTVKTAGRPWTDHRSAVEGAVWKCRSGFGKWNSIYKRFNRWAANGTWEKLLGRGPQPRRRER